MILNHKIYGDANQTLVIAHGLFGTLDNFHTLANRFAEANIKVVALDMRNHGKSQHLDSHTYADMANDIYESLNHLSIQKPIILGHIMGGKAIIKFADTYPDFAKALIVADIAPKAYNPKHDTILEALTSVDFNLLKERKQVEEQLSNYINDIGVVLFLMKNLTRNPTGDGFKWKINLKTLVEFYPEIIGFFNINKIQSKTLFIRGTKSNYISAEDIKLIEEIFSNVYFFDLNTGHWVHAEDSDGFYNAVLNFTKGLDG